MYVTSKNIMRSKSERKLDNGGHHVWNYTYPFLEGQRGGVHSRKPNFFTSPVSFLRFYGPWTPLNEANTSTSEWTSGRCPGIFDISV